MLLGAVGFAALIPFSTLSAQPVDNRPIYYVMLKSLEDAFQDYNASLTGDLNTRASRIREKYEADLLTITKEVEKLEADRAHNETVFNDSREKLNKRIAAVNEQIALRDGRLNEERRIQKHHSPRYANDPRIKALKERVAAGLAEIDAARTRYLTQSQATEKARAALTKQIEEYASAGDPLALEIQSLYEDWQRFAENERHKLKQLADVYAIDYAAYNKWLESERAELEKMRAALASAQETDREQRALHAETQSALRKLIDEYNALVEVHNKADADDPNRDDRAMKFASLEDRIAELQATLSQARNVVVNVTKEIKQRDQELADRYEHFVSEKRVRDTTLAADLAEINETRLTVEAAIENRRRKIDAQIQSLEAHISAELRDARNNLEALNARLTDSFGRDHEGFDTAITRVLEANDDSLLYTAAGTPRFDLSRPLTASVYTAVDRLEADRSEMDARIAAIERSEGSTQQGAAGETATAETGALASSFSKATPHPPDASRRNGAHSRNAGALSRRALTMSGRRLPRFTRRARV
jgi:chromosome segregation ATPase